MGSLHRRADCANYHTGTIPERASDAAGAVGRFFAIHGIAALPDDLQLLFKSRHFGDSLSRAFGKAPTLQGALECLRVHSGHDDFSEGSGMQSGGSPKPRFENAERGMFHLVGEKDFAFANIEESQMRGGAEARREPHQHAALLL